jgi:hypothetical protein
MATPGTSLLRAVRQEPYRGGRGAEWVLRADACHDVVVGDDGVVRAGGPDPPGMGGHHYGRLWNQQLTEAELQLATIPVTEFCATVCNAFVQEAVLEHASCVVLEIDASASPTVLAGRASSPGLTIAHEEFMADPLFA